MRSITQTLKIIGASSILTVATLLVSAAFTQPTFAATAKSKSSSTSTSTPSDVDPAVKNGNCSNISSCDLIKNYVDPAIALLSALVGVAVVVSIIIGGIQYSSSGGDPSKASAAKARIRNAIIALIVFISLYAMLNFLIPGGIV